MLSKRSRQVFVYFNMILEWSYAIHDFQSTFLLQGNLFFSLILYHIHWKKQISVDRIYRFLTWRPAGNYFCRSITDSTVLKAGGELSTWFTPGCCRADKFMANEYQHANFDNTELNTWLTRIDISLDIIDLQTSRDHSETFCRTSIWKSTKLQISFSNVIKLQYFFGYLNMIFEKSYDSFMSRTHCFSRETIYFSILCHI